MSSEAVEVLDKGAGWGGAGGRKGQAKLPMIYVKISCGLEPGTERRDPRLGFLVSNIHGKNKNEKVFDNNTQKNTLL